MKTLLFLLLTGCVSATMESSPNSGSEYAPVNDGTKSGTIKYLNQGADFVIKSRREDAYKQMHTACGGKYKIDAEGPRAKGGAVIPVGGGAVWDQTEYRYIQFSCAE